jgi:hypothetical protein
MTLKPESYAGAMSRLKGNAWETKCTGDQATSPDSVPPKEKCRVISDP